MLSRHFESISSSIIKGYVHNLSSYNVPTSCTYPLIIELEMDLKYQDNPQNMDICEKEHTYLVNIE